MSEDQTISMSAEANRASRDALRNSNLVVLILYPSGLSEEQEKHVGWAVEFNKPIMVWRPRDHCGIEIPKRVLEYGNFETFEGTMDELVEWVKKQRDDAN